MNVSTNFVWYPTNVTVVQVLEMLFDNLAGTFAQTFMAKLCNTAVIMYHVFFCWFFY